MLCPVCFALYGCPVCFGLYAGLPPLGQDGEDLGSADVAPAPMDDEAPPALDDTSADT